MEKIGQPKKREKRTMAEKTLKKKEKN